MKNKIIAALRLNESVINEAEVKSDGDFVVIVKKDGSEDRFKPVGLTAAEVVEKFKAIFPHSEGRAWQWLRKVEREEEREAEIEDESTVTTEEQEPINEEEDSTTECPYHNLLADLLNKENVTVQDYEAAIIKINEATEIPEDKKARIIEVLNHIKDEELEHVKEIQEADAILKGEEIDSGLEPVSPEEQEPLPPEEVPAEEPETIEVDDVEVETFESIKEAILPDEDLFKLLKGKEFDKYEDVEELLTKEGFEVVEVFKEGDGFNVNLRKDGIEYFIPFCACAGKFCATLEAPEGEKLEEGLGDLIAAKIAKVVGKGNGLNARNDLVKKLQDALGNAVKVEADKDGIKVKPNGDFIVSIDAKVDNNGLHLNGVKAIDLQPKELADQIKGLIGDVEKETPAEPEGGEGEESADGNQEDDFADLDDEAKKALDLLKSKGLKVSR